MRPTVVTLRPWARPSEPIRGSRPRPPPSHLSNRRPGLRLRSESERSWPCSPGSMRRTRRPSQLENRRAWPPGRSLLRSATRAIPSPPTAHPRPDRPRLRRPHRLRPAVPSRRGPLAAQAVARLAIPAGPVILPRQVIPEELVPAPRTPFRVAPGQVRERQLARRARPRRRPVPRRLRHHDPPADPAMARHRPQVADRDRARPVVEEAGRREPVRASEPQLRAADPGKSKRLRPHPSAARDEAGSCDPRSSSPSSRPILHTCASMKVCATIAAQLSR